MRGFVWLVYIKKGWVIFCFRFCTDFVCTHIFALQYFWSRRRMRLINIHRRRIRENMTSIAAMLKVSVPLLRWERTNTRAEGKQIALRGYGSLWFMLGNRGCNLNSPRHYWRMALYADSPCGEMRWLSWLVGNGWLPETEFMVAMFCLLFIHIILLCGRAREQCRVAIWKDYPNKRDPKIKVEVIATPGNRFLTTLKQ